MKLILCNLGKDDVYLIPYELMKLVCLNEINSGCDTCIMDAVPTGKHWDKAVKYAMRGNLDKVLEVSNAFEGSEITCCTQCNLDYGTDLVKIQFEESTGAFVNVRLNKITSNNTSNLDKDVVRLQNKLNLAGKDVGSIVVFDKEIYCIHEYINSNKVNRALKCTINGINIDKDVFYCYGCNFVDIASMKIKTFEGCCVTSINGCNAWISRVYIVNVRKVIKSTICIGDARDLVLYYLTDSTLELDEFMHVSISNVANSRININKSVKYGDVGLSDDTDKFNFTLENVENSTICFNKGCDRLTIERLVGKLRESGQGNKIGVPSYLYSKYKCLERYAGMIVDLSAGA